MGQILRTKTLPSGKVVFYVEMTAKEARGLQNHAKKVHLFSENLCVHEARVLSKGVNHEVKSVAIPLSLKSRVNSKILELAYQKIDSEDKVFYVITAKKDLLGD